MSQIKDKIELIHKKIEELIAQQFTGNVTLAYDFKEGRLMTVAFSTREQVTKGAEMVNFNNFLNS